MPWYKWRYKWRYKWCYRHARNFCLFYLFASKHVKLVAPFVAYRYVDRAIQRKVKRKGLFEHTFYLMFIYRSFVQYKMHERVQVYDHQLRPKLSYVEYLMLFSCKGIHLHILLHFIVLRINFRGILYFSMIGLSRSINILQNAIKNLDFLRIEP